MNVSSTIEVSGNSLTKISGTSSWYDAGAVSMQTIPQGDGYVEFTPGSSTTWRMCGLGNGDTGAYFADIEYALFMGGSGDLHVYESGNYRGYIGAYTATDRLRVAVEGGVVKYYRNGVLLYTSTVAPQYPLLVDTSLNTVWSTLSNVVISTRPAPNPVNYVLQDIQGSTRAVMSGSAIVARHDYLPFGEEIGADTGQRTGGQGYGVVDKIRQRYGLTERDDSSGLDHTWWRKYESYSGRWTSPDPYHGSMSIGNPQSFNHYSYTNNDPVNFVDPTGLLMTLVCWWGTQTGEVGSRYQCAFVDLPDRPGPTGDPNPGPGTGGKAPQDTQPRQEITVCQSFYLKVQEIANNAKSLKGFLDEFARTFTSASSSDPADMVAANAPTPRTHPSNQFNSNNGIRSEFRGPYDYQGQIRHFAAAFIASAGYGVGGENFMNNREDPNDPDGRTDLAVNRLAFDIRRNLEGPWSVGVDIARLKRDFARQIRERFCTG